MALSKQQANQYIAKFLDSNYDHVITCSDNIQSIIAVAESLGTIGSAVEAATAAQASADSAAASVADVLEDVVAGTGITIDKADTRNPILNVTPVTTTTLGLANVDNTSDAAKQTATLSAASKTDVGLGNVDNTADTAKPVSTAQQTALDGKVNSASVQTNVPAGAVFIDTTYSVGDAGLTEINFTSTMQVKLDSVATDANNYVHPVAAHVPGPS